jgi:hypothetical protein
MSQARHTDGGGPGVWDSKPLILWGSISPRKKTKKSHFP